MPTLADLYANKYGGVPLPKTTTTTTKKTTTTPKYNNPELAQAAITTPAVASQQAALGQQTLLNSKVQPQVFASQFEPITPTVSAPTTVQPQVFANQFVPIKPYVAPTITGPGPIQTQNYVPAPTFKNEYNAPIPLNQLAPAVTSPQPQPTFSNTWGNNPYNVLANPFSSEAEKTQARAILSGVNVPNYTTLPADVHVGGMIVPHARWEPGAYGSTAGRRTTGDNLWSTADIAADINPATGFYTSTPTRISGGGTYSPGTGTGGKDWWGNPSSGGGGSGGSNYWPQFIAALARWNIE